MPSPIAHCSLIALLPPLERRGLLPDDRPARRRVLMAMTLMALVLPDVDFAIGLIAPGSPLGTHAVGTHSFFVTAAAALILAVGWWLVFRTGFVAVLLLMLAAVWSHVVMDALTWGGPGVAVFWPISDERIGSPVRVFYGVRHSQPGAWRLHLITLVTELLFATAVCWIGRRLSKRMAGRTGQAVQT